MSWFLVYDTNTGRLVSQGTVIADPLPRGLTAVDVGTRPEGVMWDEASRSMVPRPPKEYVDRVDDIVGDARLTGVFQRMSPAELDVFKVVIGEALGDERLRPKR